jgi:C4-dicarboxylate transporter DctM subunit
MADWILGHNLGVVSFLLVTNVLLAGNASIILILAPFLFTLLGKYRITSRVPTSELIPCS